VPLYFKNKNDIENMYDLTDDTLAQFTKKLLCYYLVLMAFMYLYFSVGFFKNIILLYIVRIIYCCTQDLKLNNNNDNG